MKLKRIFIYVFQIVVIQFFYCSCLTEIIDEVSSFFCCGSCFCDTGSTTENVQGNIEQEEEQNIKVTNGYISMQKREDGNNYNISISNKEVSLRISFLNMKDEEQKDVFTNWGGFRGSAPVVIKNGSLCTEIKKTLFKAKNDNGEYTFCIKSVDDMEIEDVVAVFYINKIDDNSIRFRIQKNKITPIKKEENKIDEEKKIDEKKEEKKDVDQKIVEKNIIVTKVINMQEVDKAISKNINEQIIKTDDLLSNEVNKKIDSQNNSNSDDTNISSSTKSIYSNKSDKNIQSTYSTINNNSKNSSNISKNNSNSSNISKNNSNISKNNSNSSKNNSNSSNSSNISALFKELKGKIKYSSSKISIIVNEWVRYKELKDRLQIWFESPTGEVLCKDKKSAIFKNRGDEITNGMYTADIKNGFLLRDNDFAFTRIRDQSKNIKEVKIKITCIDVDEAIYVEDNDGNDVIHV